MKINTSIPGQMSYSELCALANLSNSLPKNSIIVEVGSLYGLGSWHISQNTHHTNTLFCIDPWLRENWILELVEKPQKALPFCQESFKIYTQDCHNIVMVPGFSPDITSGWNIPIDMYFEDSVHTRPILTKNIRFWSERVKSGGIICGHDYSKEWPDVIAEVDCLAHYYDTEIKVVDTFWSMTKP